MARPLKIGDLSLATNLLLAPIAGYCDLAFRLVVRRCGGVGLASTALLSPQGVRYQTAESLHVAATCPEDSPLAMQIYGGDEALLCEAARWAEGRGAHVVDLNMGCPVNKITRKEGGSRLLCAPDKAVRLAAAVAKSLRRIPLTVKLRLGWDESSIVAPALAARLEDAGAAAITVHGRTAEMKFTGKARLDGIAAVVAAVKRIPVIGNGDVRSPQDAAAMIERTGCAGVMIGRGALSAPWIFRDTWSFLTTGVVPPPPTLEEKVALIREHFRLLVKFRDERTASLEFRKHVGWYAKQLHPSRMLRERGQAIASLADFEQLMDEFLEYRKAQG
ncbi:MAG: tRNA dihydrouridine synthase DusB [Phycisphaerae bacterium]|nr:tRNA dihydrouridine synthase DusB [Phycisphaerae bacterium]